MLATQKTASRSENMARIRAKNTKPEIALRKALWARGARYRLYLRIEGSRPDLIFPSRKLVVFVDGCFWHGCPAHYVRPRTRSEFWAKKLIENTGRDRAQTIRLIKNGWQVLRIWEHDIEKDLKHTVENVFSALHQPPQAFGNHVIVTCVKETGTNLESWQIEDLLDAGMEVLETRSRRSQ